jgi:hypothetical protein
MENLVQKLSRHLFSEEGANVFAVLDGASVPDLLASLRERQPEYICLYRGELKPDIAEVAPYLVRLETDAEFTSWLLGKGWGKHWGIFALTFADLPEMRRHLRSFLTVYSEEGKPMLFRYYDPRVLRVYLPTCTDAELVKVFGPIEAFLLEDEKPQMLLRLRAPAGLLKQERIALSEDQAAPAV